MSPSKTRKPPSSKKKKTHAKSKAPSGPGRQTAKDPSAFPELISPEPVYPERLRDLDPPAPPALVPIRLQPRGTAGRKSSAEDETAYKLKLWISIYLRQWRYQLIGSGLSAKQADERLEKGVFGEKTIRFHLRYATLLDLSQRKIPQEMRCDRTAKINSYYKKLGAQYRKPLTTSSSLMGWEEGLYNICNALAKVAFYAGVIGPIRSDLGGEIQAGKTPMHPARNRQSTLEKNTFGDPAIQEAGIVPFLDKVIAAAHADIDPAELWLEDDGVRGIYHVATAVGNLALRNGQRTSPLSDCGRQYLDIWLHSLQTPRRAEKTVEDGAREFILRLAFDGEESEIVALSRLKLFLSVGEVPKQG